MKKSFVCDCIIFSSISILVVALSSCSSNPAPAIQAKSTNTAVIKPSITLSPSQTNTVTPIPSATLLPATLSVVATMDAIVGQRPDLQEFYHHYQQCVYMPYACVSPGLGLSPNGAWAVFFTGGGIKIISVYSKQEWGVTFSELTGTPGGGTVSVAHWSHDGKYVYVVPRQDGADGGYEWFWGWQGAQLIRLDLDTGFWTDTKMGFAFSFSPDDRYLAYRSDQGIHIHDLRTAQEKVIPISYAEYGRFTWSPDSQKILFVAAPNETDLEKRESGFTALMLDAKTQTIRIVFESNTEFLYPVEWKDMNNVRLEKLFEGFGKQYNLDLTTGVITPTQNP